MTSHSLKSQVAVTCIVQLSAHFRLSKKFSLARKQWNGAYSICDHFQCSRKCSRRVTAAAIFVRMSELFGWLLLSLWHANVSRTWRNLSSSKQKCILLIEWVGNWMTQRLSLPRSYLKSKSSSSISHGTTFLFAIYQLPKAHKYIVNTFISPCQFCEKQGHLVYKLNTQREGTVKPLSLHKHSVNQSHSTLLLARRCLTQLSALSDLLWGEIVQKLLSASSVVGTGQCVVKEACKEARRGGLVFEQAGWLLAQPGFSLH